MSNWEKFKLIMENDHVEKLQMEIDRDSECVYSINDIGVTLLHLSAYHNAYMCMLLLMRFQVNINQQGKYGGTALMSAAGQGNLEIARYLLGNGAEVSLRSVYEKSALDLALSFRWRESEKWIDLFSNYASEFDQKDVVTYKSYRLRKLFA